MELCQIIFNTCIRKRTYKRFFALLGRHFCSLKKEYVQYFENIFQNQYEIIHHLKYIRLRKVAKFFAHLLVTDAISWNVCICLIKK
jgi:pre-mRNA-splicing factor CWC22